jgi:hypothetical protein
MRSMKRWIVLLVVAVALLLAACSPRPSDASSPWNSPLGAVAWRDVPDLRNGHSWVNEESFSIPVVRTGPGDPLVNVSVPGSWGWAGGVARVNIPAGIGGAAGSNGILVVVEGNALYDFYQFTRTGPNSASASASAATFQNGPGWGPAQPVPRRRGPAAGSSSLGGLITSGDLFGGDDFRHALAVSLLVSELSSGHVAPAINGGGGTGNVPIGARLGIPAGTPMPGGLSPIGVRMWNTLVRYGAYVVDQHGGSAPVIFYADPRSVGADKVAPLRNPAVTSTASCPRCGWCSRPSSLVNPRIVRKPRDVAGVTARRGSLGSRDRIP